MALSGCDLGDGAKPLVTWSEITRQPGGDTLWPGVNFFTWWCKHVAKAVPWWY